MEVTVSFFLVLSKWVSSIGSVARRGCPAARSVVEWQQRVWNVTTRKVTGVMFLTYRLDLSSSFQFDAVHVPLDMEFDILAKPRYL